MAHVIGLITLSAAAMNSLTTVSSSVFGLLSYIQLTKNANTDELCLFLERSDAEATIKLLHSVIGELTVLNPPLVLVIETINDIISKIETALVEIRQKIDYNNSLYVLSNMRSYDCTANLKNLQTLVAILEKRRQTLFGLIGLKI
jgi:hypothetical protein